MNEISLDANVVRTPDGSTIKLTITASDIALKQQDDRWLDDLDVLFIQRDDSGLHARVDGQTLSLHLTAETYRDTMKAGIPVSRLVELRPGATSVRVLVIDKNSGRIGTITIPAAELTDH